MRAAGVQCAQALFPHWDGAYTLRPLMAEKSMRLGCFVAAAMLLALGRAFAQTPPAGPGGGLGPAVLEGLALELHAVLGHAELPLPRLLDLRVGSVVPLRTQVAGTGELNLAGQRIAFGTCGVRAGRTAFEVRTSTLRGDAP